MTLPTSWKPQQHLSGIVRESGTGEATEPVRTLLEYGLARKLEQEKAQRAAEGKEFREYPYVTDAGKCPRQLYFALTNTPKTEHLTLDSWMTLRIGQLAELAYVELLEAAGVKILSQERVELEVDGEKVVGKLDLLLEVPAEVRALIPGLDERELWELKTKNSRALGWLLKKGGPEKDDGYTKQVNLYLEAGKSGKIPAPTLARGRLVYTAVGSTKGEPLFSAYYVNHDEAAADNDLKILGQAMKDARNGVDPGVPEAYLKNPVWPCAYCDWKKLCHP